MTFCIAIQKPIIVQTCPLRPGACYWQHQQTLNCKYTPEELSIDEYCSLVGKPLPTEEELQSKFVQLRSQLENN